MLQVSIFPPVVKKTISVQFPVAVVKPYIKAVLVGKYGEQLKTFLLSELNNELSLDGFAPGAYTLRIESGSEVMAEQIIIP